MRYGVRAHICTIVNKRCSMQNVHWLNVTQAIVSHYQNCGWIMGGQQSAKRAAVQIATLVYIWAQLYIYRGWRKELKHLLASKKVYLIWSWSHSGIIPGLLDEHDLLRCSGNPCCWFYHTGQRWDRENSTIWLPKPSLIHLRASQWEDASQSCNLLWTASTHKIDWSWEKRRQ